MIHFVGTSWYGGEVVESKAARKKVRVRFTSDRWSERDVRIAEVAPQPQGAATVENEQYVLVRPKDAGDRWEPAQVVAAKAGSLEVVDRTGAKRTVAADAVVPIAAVGRAPGDKPQ